MATINVSDDQKQRLLAIMPVVQKQFPIKLSQADVFEIGISLLEIKYQSTNTN